MAEQSAARSINGWVDFEEQFVPNFTITYKRPNRPQQLANCRQGEYETDRDYPTRWCTLRNSCEGVVEMQAIMWFAQGCRHGTMLWQKLQRDMPATLAETIKIADSYALGDPMQPTLIHRDKGRLRGTTATMLVDPGSSIAPITGTRGEMIGETIDTVRPMWRP
jgi:hypothetical protein